MKINNMETRRELETAEKDMILAKKALSQKKTK
jgi:hypothetical protein